jgi:hypothetical protein
MVDGIVLDGLNVSTDAEYRVENGSVQHKE